MPRSPLLAPGLLATALGLALAAAQPAAACSVEAGYRVPTNIELAQNADLILLARVEGEEKAKDEDQGGGRPSLTLRPLIAIKGDLPKGPLLIDGLGLAGDRLAYLSNPYDLDSPHPQSMTGGCIRYAFLRGADVLFFFKRHGDAWVPSAEPFSRWAEDVPSADAPWVVATRLYAKAAALPEGERKALLTTERDRLRAQAEADPVARMMALDIDRQLAGPNEPIR